jgi:hypothetical protein
MVMTATAVGILSLSAGALALSAGAWAANDDNYVVVTAGTTALIQSDTGLLRPGHALRPGQSIRSKNGQYRLIQQNDGNLVLYHGP